MPGSGNKSLHALSVENSWFQVSPLHWTAQHLELVGCRFLKVEASNDNQGDYPQQDGRLTYYATRLATTPVENMKFHYVRSLFRGTGVLEYVLVSAAFHYGGRLVHVPQCSAFRISGHINVPHPEPIVGYYSYDADESREARFTARAGPLGIENLSVQRLYDRRLARVTPDDWTKDPYLVCIVLSLAQIQWRSDTTKQPRLYLVRLLVTHKDEQENAYIYKGDIPSQLMECLKSPTRSMSDFVFPSITVAKVAFEPFETFGCRSVEALVGPQHRSSTA
ncbi:hypothetical protein FAGAP_8834 [Fusarium agapanthi]|uniref:Uncharacterized protein n=1 Tax=Fusarium agapanthi TaxID=1803897 RepID=A0A9P5EBG7_9HYPO|nr:hypothetical protein FAGAP_8834 [Fusarium agapanthi]